MHHLVSEQFLSSVGERMTTDMNEIKSMMERMTMEIANFTMRQNQLEGQHEKAFTELKDSIDEVRKYDRGKNQEVHDTGENAEIYTPSGNPMALLPHVAGLPTFGQYSPGGFAMGASPLPTFSAQGDTMLTRVPLGSIPQPGGQGGGSNTGRHQNHHHQGTTTMSRMTKMEFPRFNGTNLRAWLCKVEQFFSLDEVAYNQRVKVASIHFDDIAIEWHLAYIRSRSHMPYPSWKEYVYALMDRFGAEYADPMSELKLVKQNGTVEDYQKEFDRIMTRLVILPEYAISAFITGLKPEIGFIVKNHRPHSLPQAYQLARNIELQVNAQLKLTKSSMFRNNSSSHPRGGSYSQPKSGSYGGN
ncbi:hypothetical protein MTR67_001067 [Solanum verrucosum]|uniref:Retrotransposon gag domain-containing protein n=1 Tax=Solanum verrucosum TaxID=315347 RepID=A0AAF0PNM1_SOLVR|nr:hypothetical protein MTR67_001067 [Solanum verrucosum]